MRFHEDQGLGVSGISLKRGSVEITDLEANTARVGARSGCATRLCANRNRKNHLCLARHRGLVAEVVTIRDPRIASETARGVGASLVPANEPALHATPKSCEGGSEAERAMPAAPKSMKAGRGVLL